MKKLCVSELMSRELVTVSPSDTLEQTVRLMRDSSRSCMIVVEDMMPVGILTERDVVRILVDVLVDGSAKLLLVSECMTKLPIRINRNATLYEALVISQSRKIRHLPVVDDDDTLVGILTQTDIANAHFKAIEFQREVIELHIADRTRELEVANEELKSLALQDALMGIGNRRAMDVDVQFTHQSAVRYQHPYTIALLDVDYFKRFNDCYGHFAGDEVLTQVADLIQSSLRASDRLYRYGGEELLVLMPETTLVDSVVVIERTLANIRRTSIEHSNSPLGILTLSAGLCDLATANAVEEQPEWTVLLEIADESLYRAKEGGRNRLVQPAR